MQINHSLKNTFIITDDKSKIDIAAVHNYLCNESYWAKNISLNIVKDAIEGSVCFGVYKNLNKSIDDLNFGLQVGFARVITDKATFGYLADVFILEEYRGIGLSKWLMHEIINHPHLQGFRGWMLATKDAHGLYAQFGFAPLEKSERIMRLSLFSEYPRNSDTSI